MYCNCIVSLTKDDDVEFHEYFSPRILLNPLMDTGNYSAHRIGTLAVDGWAVTFGTAMRGLGGLGPRPVSSSLYQM